ncbi:hypothetical protein [Ruegeria atlantica]|uniref:hypothetical protein n=1 Tax=Ruegeria atlantica TaxID=81569 RepID=UPI00147C0472|nr:hypothetical protein [Ruegeria atlantica]
MKINFLRIIALLTFTMMIGGVSMAQGVFYKKKTVGHWSIFQDGKYCWMATNFVPSGRKREMVLMVDNEGKIFVQLNPPTSTGNFDWQKISLSTDKSAFAMKDDQGWGVYLKGDHSKIRKQVLSSDKVNFDGSFTANQSRFGLKGHFKTDNGEKAYKTMFDICR